LSKSVHCLINTVNVKGTVLWDWIEPCIEHVSWRFLDF
jgi:hypothetical protein